MTTDNRRYFEWWCPKCSTILRLETSEDRDDGSRNVDCCGCYTDYTCPMCETDMWSADEAVARDLHHHRDLGRGGWSNYRTWLIRKAPMIQFDKLSPYEKGYAVYWFGENPDYPDVPKRYAPKPEERAEYERGQAAACQAAQDAP